MTLKNTLKTLISFFLLFVVVWFANGDIKIAALFSLFIAVTLIVILNTKNTYLHLKMNRFNIKSITSLENLKYYAISTIIIGFIYVFILPKFLIMMSGIFILVVLCGLFFFDIVKSIIKF